ncbi:uncharacterized protein LOC111209132 [Brassica napus]|uniref:uncharacterized protein LOC111209132 n=1 Tax=Brassica napus TaxID=3708 RepID=UPI0006AB0132|nr:uncharacterized protein LOC111209132 [Brassica napus]
MEVWCFLFKEQMKSTSQTHLGCNLLPTKRLGTSHIYGESCFWRCGFCELATTSKPDRSNEQTRTSNALALPCSKSTQKGVTENALLVGPTLHPKGFCVLRDIRCWKTWKRTLKMDKRQISLMEEEVAKAVGR